MQVRQPQIRQSVHCHQLCKYCTVHSYVIAHILVMLTTSSDGTKSSTTWQGEDADMPRCCPAGLTSACLDRVASHTVNASNFAQTGRLHSQVSLGFCHAKADSDTAASHCPVD